MKLLCLKRALDLELVPAHLWQILDLTFFSTFECGEHESICRRRKKPDTLDVIDTIINEKEGCGITPLILAICVGHTTISCRIHCNMITCGPQPQFHAEFSII